MRWILWRWFLGGGMRSFLAGYAGLPLLLGLLAAIALTIYERSMAESPIIIPGVLMACFLAPLGLGVGMVRGFWPEWGPWGGRLVFLGLLAGLVVLVAVGRWLERCNPVSNDGDGTPRVPVARVVTAHLFPTVAWNRVIDCLAMVTRNQFIGPALLVIAGVGFFCLGCAGWVLVRV